MTHDFLLRLVKRVAFRAGVRVRPCTCAASHQNEHDGSCPQTKNGRNLSDVTPHTLRRTFATSLRREGRPIDVVSKILGHSSTKVTEQFYVELEDETVAAEFLGDLSQFERPRSAKAHWTEGSVKSHHQEMQERYNSRPSSNGPTTAA